MRQCLGVDMNIETVLLILLSCHAIYTEYKLFRLKTDCYIVSTLLRETQKNNELFIEELEKFKNLTKAGKNNG